MITWANLQNQQGIKSLFSPLYVYIYILFPSLHSCREEYFLLKKVSTKIFLLLKIKAIHLYYLQMV